MNSLDTLFHRKLADKVNEALAAKEEEVLAGYIGDPGLVAMAYRAGVGYRRAMVEVLEFCQQVEQELSGGGSA